MRLPPSGSKPLNNAVLCGRLVRSDRLFQATALAKLEGGIEVMVVSSTATAKQSPVPIGLVVLTRVSPRQAAAIASLRG
jgi:hypothetical protein